MEEYFAITAVVALQVLWGHDFCATRIPMVGACQSGADRRDETRDVNSGSHPSTLLFAFVAIIDPSHLFVLPEHSEVHRQQAESPSCLLFDTLTFALW
jgi:hypothetical protein